MGRLLVVEDSRTQAEALRSLLEEDFDVSVARSGEEALEAISSESFDLVLSDVMMPGITGYELCRTLKRDSVTRELPVILLTSLNDPMDIVRGLEAGADNYITKPFDPEQLLARVRRVLDNRRLRGGARTSMGVNIAFLGTSFTITSDKEQILDLLLSSVEDTVRTNRALEESQRKLAKAHERLEIFAREKEQEAYISSERYRSLMQNAGDAIFLLDTTGAVLDANSRAMEMLAAGLDTILQRPLADFVAPDYAPAFQVALKTVWRQSMVQAMESCFLAANGRRVLGEVSLSSSAGSGDDLVLAIVRDVTARKIAEENLKKSEQQLAEAQQIASLGNWDWEAATGELRCSEEFYRIFGKRFTNTGPAWFEEFIACVHPDDRERVERDMDVAIAEGAAMHIEFRIVTPDGEERVVFGQSQVLSDEAGAVMRHFGTVQDITERKRTEEALRRSEEQLRHAQRLEAIGRLTGGIAHDFNNVLTAIKGSTELLLMDIPPESPLRFELEQVDEAATRATALTRQLLAFSRKQVLQPKVLDVNGTISAMSRMLSKLIGEDIQLAITLDPALGHIYADPTQVEQIIMNLAVNARDAMPQGGRLRIETRMIRVEEAAAGSRDLPAGEYVGVIVSDSGTGMSAEVQERIFEPFYTTKGPGQGTGLGLSTVYGIVKQSQALIEVQSEEGSGTTFRLLFPQVAGPVEREASDTEPEPGSGAETVLLVEDEEAVRRLAVRLLMKSGYRVLEADNAKAALKLAEQHEGPIHLLLTDMMMPGMSGTELARRLTQLRPDVRVLYMSGYAEEDLNQNGRTRNGVRLVEKPFTRQQFTDQVRRALDS